jgi:hypothetical protein
MYQTTSTQNGSWYLPQWLTQLSYCVSVLVAVAIGCLYWIVLTLPTGWKWPLHSALSLYDLWNWLTYLMEQSPSSEANQSLHLVKNSPHFYGTRSFFTVLTSACHLSLSWANSIQSPQPPPTSSRSIYILSSHLRLGLPSGLFPSGFPTNTLCTTLSSPIRATGLTQLSVLNVTTHTILHS